MRKDIAAMLEQLLQNTFEILPKLSTALLVIVLGYVLGKILERLVRRLVLFLNSRANEVLKNKMVDVDLRASARFISRTVFWITLSISILICIQILDLGFSAGIWLNKVIAFVPNILVAILIVFVGIMAGRLLSDLIKVAALRTGMVNGIYLGRIVKYLTLFVSIIVALDQLGVDITFLKYLIFIVLAGLLFGASLAFGLGAQTSVSNILGAYYTKKTHQIGKKIRIDDIQGVIVRMTDHDVLVETNEGLVVIPAKKFNENNVSIIEDGDE